MSRQLKKAKPLIYIFYEGESEYAYADFLKKRFKDVAVIMMPSATGLFEKAARCFENEAKFRDSKNVTDEIWFFFDVERDDAGKWEKRFKIIKKLRKRRKSPDIKVRLLMTTGCVEYWFMLHYKMYAPPLQTVAEKERVITELEGKVPTYFKGDLVSTSHIAEKYPTAIRHAEKILQNLLHDGMPSLEETDERDKWLCTQCKTFSTVHEAIQYLESLA